MKNIQDTMNQLASAVLVELAPYFIEKSAGGTLRIVDRNNCHVCDIESGSMAYGVNIAGVLAYNVMRSLNETAYRAIQHDASMIELRDAIRTQLDETANYKGE